MQHTKVVSLWLVLFVIFLDWLGIGIVYPMFSAMLFHPTDPYLAAEASASIKGLYLGLMLAAMSVAQFFSSPVIGALSDQKGRRPLLLITLMIAVAGYACCLVGVLAKSVVILIFARLIIGIAAGNSAVVSATVADISTTENKAKNFGLFSMACGVGFAIGPFLGGKLSTSSYELPFIVAGLATLINLLMIFLWFKESHVAPKTAPIRFADGVKNLKKAFHMKGIRAIFLTVFVFLFGWSFFYEFVPITWIADFGIDAARIGLFYGYGAAFYALSSGLLIRPIVSKFKAEKVLFCALVLLGITITLLLIPHTEVWVWVYLPILNFLTSLVYPTTTTMVSNWASKDAQGETLGILQSIQAASFAISPLSAGVLLGLSPHMPMILGGTAMLLAALIAGVFLRKMIFADAK